MTDASNPVNLREAKLDEPITTTIMRDVKKVLTKVFHVLVPRTFSRDAQGVSALRDWDLWGPLIICMLLSVFLSMGKSNTEENQNSAVFAASFVIVWAGAGVITLNALLLGGTLGFFQSVCILGYCVFPLMVASFLCLIPSLIQSMSSIANTAFRVIVVVVAILWACTASIGFFAGVVPDGRKALAMYPVLLFYAVIGWMVVLGTNTPQHTKPPTAVGY